MCGFSPTLTTTAHSPQQLGAVWHLHLHADAEGPTFISTTARRLLVYVFYIATSQSSSGHTNALAEAFNTSTTSAAGGEEPAFVAVCCLTGSTARPIHCKLSAVSGS